MRIVVWLASIFVASLLLGVCWWFSGAFVTGSNRALEGMLGLAIVIILVAAGSSGILLLMIGPTALYEHFRQTRGRQAEHESESSNDDAG
jgi:hypothetical protein